MNLLELFFTVSWVIIFILGLDIARRQKFNALHFLIFLGIGSGLLVFTFFPNVLNSFGRLFWLQRGADLLVYSSIIFLIYFFLLLLRKTEENRSDLTKIVREIAIENSGKKYLRWEILFLVRAYNEGPVIWNTVETIIQAWYSNIIIVDDGSCDDTEHIIKKIQEKNTSAPLIYMKHFKNRGAGAALETGFEYGRRFWEVEYICSFDADGQHNIADINNFLDILRKRQDIQAVFWSRFINKTTINIPLIRKIILKLAIIFTFFLSHIKLTDAHNGYRVFRKEVLDNIHLSIDGMGYASELIDIIATKKINFLEVPVHILYTDYSIAKWQKSSNAINIALKFIWNKFFK